MLFQDKSSSKDTQPTSTTTEKFDLTSILKEIGDLKTLVSSNIGGKAIDELVKSLNTAEDAAGRLATKFGGSRDLSRAIGVNIIQATTSVMELGGQMEDVQKIQEGVVNGLQTQTILNEKAYQDFFAIGQLIGDGTKTNAETTAKMVRSFTDAGYGLYNIGKEMTGVLNTAREVGVTATAVYGQLEKNIGKLALYNFDNGVQGMAQMAAKAAGLRIDMSSTLKVADELFNPEKAFEMAASFQRLGVQVTSLLDPYKLMDMARNDPKKLQESLLEASKSLTYFDEKNKKMSILPGAQAQLREIATAAGINTEEFAKMAINAGEFDRKMSTIKFPSAFANEKDKEMIANMAQMEGNEYKINFGEDEKGNPIFKAVKDLTESDRLQLEKMNEPAKSAVDLQKEANGYLKNMANRMGALRGVLPRAAATSPEIPKTFRTLGEKLKPGIEAAESKLGVTRDSTGYPNIDNASENVTKFLNVFSKNMDDMIIHGKNVDTGIKDMGTQLINAGKDIEKAFQDVIKSIKTGKAISSVIPTSVNTVPTTTISTTPTTVNTVSSNTTNSGSNSVDVSGTININVNPANMKTEVITALQSAGFENILTNMVMNNLDNRQTLKGNANVSNRPQLV